MCWINICGSSSSSGGEFKLFYNYVNLNVGFMFLRFFLFLKECFGVLYILSFYFEVMFLVDYFGLFEIKGILFMYNFNILYSIVYNKKKEWSSLFFDLRK